MYIHDIVLSGFWQNCTCIIIFWTVVTIVAALNEITEHSDSSGINLAGIGHASSWEPGFHKQVLQFNSNLVEPPTFGLPG